MFPTGVRTVYLTSQCCAPRNPRVKHTTEDHNTRKFYTWRMREDTRYSKQRLGKFQEDRRKLPENRPSPTAVEIRLQVIELQDSQLRGQWCHVIPNSFCPHLLSYLLTICEWKQDILLYFPRQARKIFTLQFISNSSQARNPFSNGIKRPYSRLIAINN